MLAKNTSAGNFYFHYDGSGNVVQLTDSSQNRVAEYSYDAYGVLLSSTGAQAAGNLYRYSTKEFHAASGLYDYGLRFYSPGLGRWINRDPIEEDGGLNLYEFNHNSPTNYVDPDGAIPIPLIIAGGYMVFEVGMTLWDAYDTGRTLLDPCASGTEKSMVGGLFIAGMVGPGAGYNTAGKAAVRNAPNPFGMLGKPSMTCTPN